MSVPQTVREIACMTVISWYSGFANHSCSDFLPNNCDCKSARIVALYFLLSFSSEVINEHGDATVWRLYKSLPFLPNGAWQQWAGRILLIKGVCVFLKFCFTTSYCSSVIKNLIFTHARRGTFQNKSSAGQNIASMRVSKFRGFDGAKWPVFSICLFSVTYKRTLFRHIVMELRLSCRKGLLRLSRGPYGNATRAPPHYESGPAATQGGPYGKKTGAFSDKNSNHKVAQILAPEKL